jgi:aminoglycoside phosphotransferase (APT) family kinase protein
VIPDAMREAAWTAIAHAERTAYPGATLESVTVLSGGMSGALVYLVRLGGHELVLRIVAQRTPLNDPARAQECAQRAADAGVAPPVLYANVETGVSLTLRVVPPTVPVPRDAAQLGALLRSLHRAPKFPTYLTTFEAIDGGLAQLARHGVPLPSLVRDVVDAYRAIESLVARDLTLAPCHNDLNPGNVLTDGVRQWLVDWDSACMNEPLFDVCSALHWFRLDTTREAALLSAYYGRTPSAQERARVELMKQVVWCYYMLVFLLIALPDGGVADMDQIPRDSLPRFSSFIDGVVRGEHQLHLAPTRRLLSLILGRESLLTMQRAEYTEAIALLSR